MNEFDRNEERIRDAFLRIDVDTERLGEQTKCRLRERKDTPQRPRLRISAAAAIVMSALFVITAAAATLGSFDWLTEKINPDFGAIIEPVEEACEDNGIRMEVIGAQKYGNAAIVYLSLQDVSGKNRLTENTSFQDGFSVKMDRGSKDNQEKEVLCGMGYSEKILSFDRETNTIYYEFNITGAGNSPISDPLTLGSSLIYFDTKHYENEPVDLSLSNLTKAKTMEIRKENVWGAGSGTRLPNDAERSGDVLLPGKYGVLPHGQKDQWISNAGIVDGKLHVQVGAVWGKEFGSSDAGFSLTDPNGKTIEADYNLTLLSDKKGRLIDTEKDSYDDAVYKYQEFVFPVGSDLDGYKLVYNGFVTNGTEGAWKVSASLSDTSNKMRTWTSDIVVGGHLLERLTLSPLGLQAEGSFKGKECSVSEMSVAVETSDGLVSLQGGGGSEDETEKTFDFRWNAEKPLDVTKATAVVVNGVRIPIR